MSIRTPCGSAGLHGLRVIGSPIPLYSKVYRPSKYFRGAENNASSSVDRCCRTAILAVFLETVYLDLFCQIVTQFCHASPKDSYHYGFPDLFVWPRRLTAGRHHGPFIELNLPEQTPTTKRFNKKIVPGQNSIWYSFPSTHWAQGAHHCASFASRSQFRDGLLFYYQL